MQTTREQSLPITPRATWNALTDVNILRTCIPGCESLTALSPTEFAVTVVASLGPLRATIKGIIELHRYGDRDPPPSYTLHFDGYGRLLGQAQGEALVQLAAHTDGSTILRYGVQAKVSSPLARAGAHFIDAAVQQLADAFFTRFAAVVSHSLVKVGNLIPS